MSAVRFVQIELALHRNQTPQRLFIDQSYRLHSGLMASSTQQVTALCRNVFKCRIITLSLTGFQYAKGTFAIVFSSLIASTLPQRHSAELSIALFSSVSLENFLPKLNCFSTLQHQHLCGIECKPTQV